ncbi:AraC family transcriptional regulator [Actinoplanes sp. NPDC051633]|uniref:AraC family transcriptional regulator n=1 Tax=Actinoplanes sp. NPDC051633 TaxID=3155670 RepID=UPI00343868B0
MRPGTDEILRLLATVNGRRRGDVSLPILARLAHRSPFDLHRRFRRLVGETPRVYTSRVRLARAAAALQTTDRPAWRIAAEHGFASYEVFTRSFTRHFGVGPRQYRARGLPAGDNRTYAAHVAAVDAAAPCVGLYRQEPTERNTEVSVDVTVEQQTETYALIMRRRTGRAGIADALSACLPAVFGYAQRHGLAMTGPPFARYPEVGMGSVVIEAGCPVTALPAEQPGDGIEPLTIPAGPAAVAVHRGPYEGLSATHEAVEEWMRVNGHEAAGPAMETYLTDPGEHPDPQTWLTRITIPLR